MVLDMNIPSSLESITKEVIETPSAKRFIDNLIYKFIRKFNLPLEKIRIEDNIALNQYATAIEVGQNAIPVENRIVPRPCIVDRAIETSLYFLDENSILILFQNLIISAADERFASRLHPSFVDIIQQLSPLDAENLKLFAEKVVQDMDSELPIADYIYENEKHAFEIFQKNVFLENHLEQDIHLQAVSIDNLARLNLIYVPDYVEKGFSRIEDESLFEKYYQTEMFLNATTNIPAEYVKVNILPGYARLTDLGKDSITVCLGLS